MIDRADVERIVENVLNDLKVKVESGEFGHKVLLMHKDRVISTDYFDVGQTYWK